MSANDANTNVTPAAGTPTQEAIPLDAEADEDEAMAPEEDAAEDAEVETATAEEAAAEEARRQRLPHSSVIPTD